MDWNDIAQWVRWFGSPSQLALLAVIIVALIKVWPIIQKQVSEARAGREGRYGARIEHLEKELTRCHVECQDRIDTLQTKLANEARQRLQSEISLVHTLIQIVDAPQLRTILAALERRRTNLNDVESVKGPVSDTKGDDLC